MDCNDEGGYEKMNYEEFVKTTDTKVGEHDLQFYLDGMNEEHGEISGVIKRARRGDYGEDIRQTLAEIDSRLRYILTKTIVRADIIKEIGDRHWYETRFLQEIKADWNMVEQYNMDKLQKRVDKNLIVGKGSNRENEQKTEVC